MKIHDEIEFYKAMRMAENLLKVNPKPYSVQGLVLKWTAEAIQQYEKELIRKESQQ